MLRNYFTIAWRNLSRNRVYSAINILGLALGMAVVLLIGAWIKEAMSYNTSFPNYQRIVRILHNSTHSGQTITSFANPIPLAGELRTQYAGDLKRVALATWPVDHVLSTDNGKPLINRGAFAEQEFADMLSLSMLSGSRSLKNPGSILLSRQLATAIFGQQDPIDRLIKLDNKSTLKVTGVYEDIPDNTDLNGLKFLVDWNFYMSTQSGVDPKAPDWNSNAFQLFAELQPNADLTKLGAKVKGALSGHARNDFPEVLIHPMPRWHLYGEFKGGKNTGGDIRYVRMFGYIGVFILLLACINFMNLSTARSQRRAKEVGIRKAMGSLRLQLIFQFLGESALLACLAAVLAVLLATVSLPWFSQLADMPVHISWTSPLFLVLMLGVTLVTGLLAGSYPALYLSSFNAVKVLKGSLRAGRLASLPRKILIVLQFTVSISLIIGTIVVFRQIQYLKNRPVGYTREGLLSVQMTTDDLVHHYALIREELKASGAVSETAASSNSTTDGSWHQSGFSWAKKDPGMVPSFEINFTTSDYGRTIGWELQQGRDFSRDFPTDSAAMVINEAAVRYIGLKEPIGATIQYLYSDRKDNRYHIIGVVKDMVTSSPDEQIGPAIYMMDTSNVGVITVKVNPMMSMASALPKISAVFRKYNPGAPFDYKFNSEEYARKFQMDERVLRLATFFTLFAIFISCLGLFGLASYMAEQRVREIGVRKVLGASVPQLWSLLSRDFVGLVCIAFLIALPLAWYGMHQWLQGYDYRTGISGWIFVFTLVGTLLITLVTVSAQGLRAAMANPAATLRTGE